MGQKNDVAKNCSSSNWSSIRNWSQGVRINIEIGF